MKRKFKAGLTSVSLPIFIADTSSTTGGGLSGITSASSGLVIEYRRAGQSTWTSVTPQAGKTLGSYLSGGIVADGSLLGAYEVDFPDAAFASGARMVVCRVRGVTNMLAVLIEIELDAVDYQDATAFGLAKFGDIETDTQNIQSRIPTALVDGRMVANAQVVGDKTGYTATVSDKTGFSLLPTTGLGNQTGTVGGISGVSFPANFSLLSITSGGAIASVINVLVVDELGAGALVANGAGDAIPVYVWNALLADHTTANTFGARVVRSTNSNNTVQISGGGSNHIFAVLHDAEPNSIPEDAFVTGAISARAIGTDAIDGDAMASSALTEIATAVGALQVLTRLDSMIESDGAGQFQFDTIALQMAPAGGGGGTDWTANERIAIRSILGVPTSGTTPTDPTVGILEEIRDKTALITSGNVQTSIPVTAQGQINGPWYIGDDYLAANGRAFDWTIALPTGFVAATSTCKFGMIYEDETGVSQFNLAGTVTDVGGGNVRLRFELPRATTGTLKAGFHRWSVEIVSASGVEVTPVAYNDRKLVEWREKQT